VYLDRSSTPARYQIDPDIIGVVDDSADQMLDGVDHDRTHD
jgi:hypothetical protein